MSEFPEWIEDRIGFRDVSYREALEIHRQIADGTFDGKTFFGSNPDGGKSIRLQAIAARIVGFVVRLVRW